MPTTQPSQQQRNDASREQALKQRQASASRASTALKTFVGNPKPEHLSQALRALRALTGHYGGKLPDVDVRMAAKVLSGSSTFNDVASQKTAAQKVATWCDVESTRGHDVPVSDEVPVSVSPTPTTDDQEPTDDDDNHDN